MGFVPLPSQFNFYFYPHLLPQTFPPFAPHLSFSGCDSNTLKQEGAPYLERSSSSRHKQQGSPLGLILLQGKKGRKRRRRRRPTTSDWFSFIYIFFLNIHNFHLEFTLFLNRAVVFAQIKLRYVLTCCPKCLRLHKC